jgi:sarcosine oxidase subunit gamma
VSEIATGGVGSMTPGHYGAAGTDIILSETTITTAWNVQGDPARTSLVGEVERRFGVALPRVPNTTASADALLALWLGPRSWLLVEGRSQAQRTAPSDFDAKRDAINGAGGALFDVTSSRVAYTLAGAQAPVVLARCCPLDFDARAFLPGHCAQSMLGRIGALFYRHAQTPAFTVMVARSLAADAWRALCVAAVTDGYDVKRPSPFDAQSGSE